MSLIRFFQAKELSVEALATEGVACVGFPTANEDDVLASCASFGLGGVPKLFLSSSLPLVDIKTLNTAVNEAKMALTAFRGRHQLRRLHLFVKAPSVFAMGLGYRLNGLGVIQLHDWIDGTYKATAELR